MAIGNIISKVIGGLGDSASKVMGGIANLKRISSVDKTQQENNIHSETVQMMKAYASEMGKENKNLADSIIDFIVRLPRPIIAYITIALLLVCLLSPAYAKSVAMAFKSLPTHLYYIIGAVIGFYFGGRMLNNKWQANKPKMSAEQHATLIGAVQTTEQKITDSNLKMEEGLRSNQEIMNEMTDLDKDSLDQKGMNHIMESEGFEDKMYKCPAGYPTIGYGVNLEAQKIPKVVAELWLTHIVNKVKKELENKYLFITKLDKVRYWIVVDMAYNLGVYNQKTLKRTMTELEKQLTKRTPNYKKVARTMKAGKWFKQVGIRSKKLVKRMETGRWG